MRCNSLTSIFKCFASDNHGNLQRVVNCIDKVENFITISAPHNGTLTGYALNLAAPIQMRPKSNFLENLNQDIALLDKTNFTSIWTPYDAMILPPKSSQVPVGRDIKIDVFLHPWMVSDEKVLKVIVEELKGEYR